MIHKLRARSRVRKDEMCVHAEQDTFKSSNCVGLGSLMLHRSGNELVCLFVLLKNGFLLLFASYNALLPLGGKDCNQLMQMELWRSTQKCLTPSTERFGLFCITLSTVIIIWKNCKYLLAGNF